MGSAGYEAAVEYLERIPSYAKEKSPLPAVRGFLGLLGNPDREFQFFHVAGTNGKGSVCAFLTAVFKESGYAVGTFTSPHLTELAERFAVGGATASKAAVAEAFERVRAAADAWVFAGNPHPTYFEFLFYMCLLLFQKAGVKLVVLETGMGGLKDVTNVIERPLVSVITSISIDHAKYLGDTAAEIAVHKAGIIKAGSPAVYDASCPEAEKVIRLRAEELGCELWPVGSSSYAVKWFGESSMEIEVEFRGSRVGLTVPFAAPYQAANAALAVKALEVSGLPVGAETLRAGIGKAFWPARMERVRPWLYLDGAHNEGGVLAFLAAACILKEKKKPDSVCVLFAVSADKDYRRMLALIDRRLRPDRWILAQADSGRALPVEELSLAARSVIRAGDGGKPAVEPECYENTALALRALLQGKTENGLAFIVGSLYLAGEMKKEITDD